VIRLERATLAAVLTAASMSAAALELDPQKVRWTELEYRAKKLTFSASTTILYGLVATSASRAQLTKPGQGIAVEATGPEVARVDLETQGMGRRTTTTLWLDPTSAAALQRSQAEAGSKPRIKTYRFTGDGVFATLRRPASGESDRPHDRWSDVSEGFRDYPEWTGRGLIVSEPSVLFYLVSAAPLRAQGDLVQLPVFSKDRLLLVELRVVGTESVKVDFERRTATGTQRIKGSREALRLVVDARRLGPESAEGDLSFLGLQGDVELLVDRESGAPLEVRGRVPVAGRVTVRLQRVTLR
jgi:hypothetical protein